MNNNGLKNAAYSTEYIARKNKIIETALHPQNRLAEKQFEENGYRREVVEYSTQNEEGKYFCSTNSIYDPMGKKLFEYTNLYHHPFFCTPVQHQNGHQYLLYKEDVYGYSVADMITGKTYQYYPAKSFTGGETFIATDVYYNPRNNIVAAEGCYWACPIDTFLFSFDTPMSGFASYLNLHLLLDEEYESFDDICFSAWQETSIKLKCYDVRRKPHQNIEMLVTQEDYLPKMNLME